VTQLLFLQPALHSILPIAHRTLQDRLDARFRTRFLHRSRWNAPRARLNRRLPICGKLRGACKCLWKRLLRDFGRKSPHYGNVDAMGFGN